MNFGLQIIGEYERLKNEVEDILKPRRVKLPIFLLHNDSILYKIAFFPSQYLPARDIFEITETYDIYTVIWEKEKEEYEKERYRERLILRRALCLKEKGWDSHMLSQNLIGRLRTYQYAPYVPSAPA